MLCLTEGQMSDHIGAKLLYPALPSHNCIMIGDKGYDSDEYRAALLAKNITPCIPPRKGRLVPADFDKNLYRQRHCVAREQPANSCRFRSNNIPFIRRFEDDIFGAFHNRH